MRLGTPPEMHDNVIVCDGGQGIDHVAGRMPCEFRQQDGLRPVPAEPAQDDGCRLPHRRLRIGKTGFQTPEFRPAECAQPYRELPDLRISMRQQGTGEGSGKPEGHRQGGAQRHR